MTNLTPEFLAHAWEVLVLFLVPFGGGIPVGVVVAKKYAIEWPLTSFLYFISDVMLAIAFEPLLRYFLKKSETVLAFAKMRESLSKSSGWIITQYGAHPGALALVLITFGSDPMTGRSVSKALGHGIFSGWALVILGDMIFFGVVMASTLLLNNILGDGTWAAVIITVVLLAFPAVLRRFKKTKKAEM